MPKIAKCLNCDSHNIKIIHSDYYGYQWICVNCGEISTNFKKPKIKVTLF